MAKESTDIAVIDTKVVEAALMGKGELPTIEDPEEVAKAIMLRILDAESPDEVFDMFEATSGKDVLGIPLEVHGVRWQRSSFQEGSPVYALMDAATLDDGKRRVVTTSGRSVLAALLAWQRMNAFPIRLKLEESKNATPQGYKPLRIARI